jgi:UDP-N-acetylmuramate--alanine ligase
MGAIHFVGVAGTGMSALAQIQALSGARVTGSDRLADREALGETRRRLEAAGISLFPQDGSGLAPDTARLVVSTAIEPDNPELLRAQALGLPIVHRADELAALAAMRRCVAVAGTSGKSTVSALVFQILETAGRSPSLACGANLPSLRRRGLLGNAWRGESDLLVIEADESDGTLTRYAPFLGLLLNMSKDHKELTELSTVFGTFRDRSERLVVNADAPGLSVFEKGGLTFGFSAGKVRGRGLELGPQGCRFMVEGVAMRLGVPGRHNAENALAAAAACRELGVSWAEAAAGLAAYEGIGRRFELVGSARGVEVVDDYAHNPEKVRAAIAAARLRSKRVLAVFQLHGFAPARFLKGEFLEAFAESLGPEDVLWLPKIYYVGGTAAKDVSAADYARELSARGKKVRHVARREDIAGEVAAEAKAGDLVLVMGARDASLSDFAGLVLRSL